MKAKTLTIKDMPDPIAGRRLQGRVNHSDARPLPHVVLDPDLVHETQRRRLQPA
jgi:hypothetical protein